MSKAEPAAHAAPADVFTATMEQNRSPRSARMPVFADSTSEQVLQKGKREAESRCNGDRQGRTPSLLPGDGAVSTGTGLVRINASCLSLYHPYLYSVAFQSVSLLYTLLA